MAVCIWNWGTLGLVVLLLRLQVPESPRWRMLRGKERKQIGSSKTSRQRSGREELPSPEGEKLKLAVQDHTPLKEIFESMLSEDNRSRSF